MPQTKSCWSAVVQSPQNDDTCKRRTRFRQVRAHKMTHFQNQNESCMSYYWCQRCVSEFAIVRGPLLCGSMCVCMVQSKGRAVSRLLESFAADDGFQLGGDSSFSDEDEENSSSSIRHSPGDFQPGKEICAKPLTDWLTDFHWLHTHLYEFCLGHIHQVVVHTTTWGELPFKIKKRKVAFHIFQNVYTDNIPHLCCDWASRTQTEHIHRLYVFNRNWYLIASVFHFCSQLLQTAYWPKTCWLKDWKFSSVKKMSFCMLPAWELWICLTCEHNANTLCVWNPSIIQH